MTHGKVIRFGAITVALSALMLVMSPAGPVRAADAGNPRIAGSPASLRSAGPPQRPIQALHDRLKITPAQEPLWANVAALVRRNDEAIDALSRQRENSASRMTAVDDLRSFVAITAAHAVATKAFLSAFAALYDVMPTDQQANADRVFRTAVPKAPPGIPRPR
jgi:hypothetical protein